MKNNSYKINLDKYYISKKITEDTLRNEPGFELFTNRILYRRRLITGKAFVELIIYRATFNVFEFNRLYDENMTEEEFNEAETKLIEIIDGLVKKGILVYEG